MTIIKNIVGDIANNITRSIIIDFLPTNIENLLVWLDASDTSTIVESSNSVSQWNDKRLPFSHVTQLIGSNQPLTNTRTENGLNVIHFNGTSHFLEFANDDIFNSPVTIFAVARSDDASGFQNIIGRQNAGIDGTGFLRYTGTSASQVVIRGTTDNTINYTITRNKVNIFVVRYDNGQNSSFKADGGSFINASNPLAGYSNRTDFNAQIGKRPDATSNYLNGAVCEVLIYNRVLTNQEVSLVENYLNNKWGAF